MTGSFGELGSLLKQAQEMQRQVERAKAELAKSTVDGRSPDGSVLATVGGDQRVLKVEISDAAHAKLSKAELERALLAALRDANEKAAARAREMIGKVTGGLNLPGLF